MLTKQRERKKRRIVLIHYSLDNNDIPVCACCGEFTYELLTIDHILPKDQYPDDARCAGSDLVHWIIKNDFPPIFQILCYNCNIGKYKFGSCPHKWIDQKNTQTLSSKTGGHL